MTMRFQVILALLGAFLLAGPALTQEIPPDGTQTIPPAADPLVIPFSPFASPEALAALRDSRTRGAPPLADVKASHAFTSDISVSRAFYDRWNSDRLNRMKTLYPVSIAAETIGGIVTDVVIPEGGIAPANKDRVLINLHGGGFQWGAHSGGLVESVPVAALGRIKVVTVDYREGPENHFPAASEDIAAVYAALLKTYRPENVGIYGCSAGGFLTAEALAWFQTHALPRPGAAGIFCAGVVELGGDSDVTAPILAGHWPSGALRVASSPYFKGADMTDPMVLPGLSPTVLKGFPPILLISGTRDFALSETLHSQDLLERAGVPVELHVWEGVGHSFFSDPEPPESKEAYRVIARFFERTLGKPK
jgi:acetyl esterase/lipase